MKLKKIKNSLSKKKIEEEIKRHWFFVESFLPFLISIIFYFSLLPFFSFINLMFLLIGFIVSSFLPDALFVFLGAVFNIPLEKLRRKTHSLFSCIFYAIFLLFMLPFFVRISFLDSLIFSLFSFFGYFSHILVDKYEEVLEFIKKARKFNWKKVLFQSL